MDNTSAIFLSETYGELTLEGMIEAIISFIKRDTGRLYRIAVGTDSSSDSSGPVPLVTAVSVHRVGNGGIHFRTRSQAKKFATLRERIWQEAINSITLFQEVRSHLRDALGEEFFLQGNEIRVEFNEIHVDIGQNGATRDFIEPVVGMIRGYGFQPVIKPDSYCASVIADRGT